MNHNTSHDLKGKTILVTGASSGIGAATALALGQAGANVVLAARRTSALQALSDTIISSGGQALVVTTDVTQEADIANAVSQAVQRFGKLDGAFNNAGVLGQGVPLHEQSSDLFDHVIRSNVNSVFWSMKHEIAAMLKTGGGAIVNNASVVAAVSMPGLSTYTASKHAVLGLTRGAALDYFQQGIRVNAVCPGIVATPMSDAAFGSSEAREAMVQTIPAGRSAQPQEIATTVLFLLSAAASFVAGQGLMVDGAYTAQ